MQLHVLHECVMGLSHIVESYLGLVRACHLQEPSQEQAHGVLEDDDDSRVLKSPIMSTWSCAAVSPLSLSALGGTHRRSGIQLLWNPKGTRCGNAIVATGSREKSAASRITRSLLLRAAS